MLQVALIGYGLAGKVFHAPLIKATPGLNLKHVIASDQAKVHADWPEVAVSARLEDVLADPATDLVVIATPDHLHKPQALAALQAGKHVVVDKPLAPSLADAREIAACAAAQNRVLAVFHNRRWDADFLTLQRLISEGALGEIVQFESHFDRLRPVSQDRWKDHRAAGLWQDLGPHLVDQALQLFGMPIAVFADLATQREGGPAPDYAHVLLRYPRTRAILHMSQSTHASSLRFAVHGTAGSYIKHGLDHQEDQSKDGMTPDDARWGADPEPGALTRFQADGALTDTVVPNARGDYLQFYATLAKAIRGEAPDPVPPDQALAVMTIIEAGRISTAERREILIGDVL